MYSSHPSGSDPPVFSGVAEMLNLSCLHGYLSEKVFNGNGGKHSVLSVLCSH